jgi:hypothetical protein
MKKMIGVINDNLRSVVNGIKEHRVDAENNLSVVKNEIDEKVETASIYKGEVEKAHGIITNYESEISELETDLKELNEKFGSKDFKEILAAGDKEINTKIIEKRAMISEQKDIITDITKKAHSLKKELIKLKDRKNAIEEDLNKTLILEGYYEKRINAIIDFSLEHPEDLATYKEVAEVEDLSTEEIEDINIDNIIDGQVFNEIDSISNGESDIPENVVDDILAEDTHEEEVKEENEFSNLDDIINVATEIIDRNEINKDEEDTHEEEVVEEKVPEVEHPHIELHTMSEPITVNLDNLDNPIKTVDNSAFKEDNGLNDNNLAICGLRRENFDPEDLRMLEPVFDKNNTQEFIRVLNNHGFSVDKVYTSVSVLINVTPQNLDKMLTMLEGVANHNDIDYVFRYLDKVNISKLEQNILTSNDSSLAELISSSLNSHGNANLSNLLGLSDSDVDYIKKNNKDDYELMIDFPEIVLANYNTLKKFNINNLNECITKYPHRFTFNPSKFALILDKYDPEDLVRCINKNAQVIDKL